jgi:hypothetical protein
MDPGFRVSALLLLLATVVGGAGCGSPDTTAPARPAVSAQPPDRQDVCMPRPVACGFPDLTNTGVAPGTKLGTVEGAITLDHPGEVYENKQVTGAIVVTARDVTIRNVRLVVTDPYYGISVKPGGNWDDDRANLLVDNVEIDMNGHLGLRAIAFNGYTLRRTFIHNGADCAHFGDDVTIADSLCVLGPDADGDGWPDATEFCKQPEHFDGFQSNGATRSSIRHNTVRNPCPQTSAIALFGAVHDVAVTGNLMAGGGYPLYCGSPDATNVVVVANRFATVWHARSGQFGTMAHCDAGVTLRDNGLDRAKGQG